MPVTIRDIAKKLNISHSTVSRVLNNRGEQYISEGTRQRVLETCRELGYLPNLAARALSTGRTGTIAVWSSSIHEPFYWQVLNALEDEVTGDNFRMLVRRSRNHREDLMKALVSNDVDGVIVIDAFPAIRGSLTVPPELGAPCVFLGVYAPEYCDRVSVDLTRGLEEAVSRMIEGGRERVAYLVNSEYAWMLTDEDVRHRIYTRLMAAAGRKPEIIRFPSADCTSAGPALIEYVREYGHPDGLLCQNDVAAMSAYRSLRDLGLRVPEDVALAGCDGSPEMAYFDPPLSTIAQPVQAMCRLAWEFLKSRMSDPTLPVQAATLPANLLVRPSLG